MTPEDLQTALARALASADAGLVAPGFDAPIDVLAPTRSDLGDWTTPVALRAAASPDRRTELAAHLCAELRGLPAVADAVIAEPGFVNVTLTPVGRAHIVCNIVISAETDSGGGAGPERTPLPALLAVSYRGSAQALFAGGCDDHIDPNAVQVLQRGHAAACREQRRAHRAGIATEGVDPGSLTHPSETRMLNALAGLPSALERSRRLGGAEPFLTALVDLADTVEDWIRRCPVTPTVDEDITVTHNSRLLALRAVIIVLAAGLRQLGASAPERI
ncbi:DALR anticodon-binding domain-containing protein [Brevibacterium siliguriense]|uniref:DALR anticodon-binding domain-containing protein n=1 Tax=Brevibacterium siliguriense TaxID=1136497 RepID=UPI001E342951|nr:DALR anticodon-binding domain-containing protein [Brevibacterium siliguriense]